MPTIVPTVGRKVYFYANAEQIEPIDATIVAVLHVEGEADHPLTPVSLFTIDATGSTGFQSPMIASDDPVDQPHYRWMPYQLSQATVTKPTKL